jgi:hypothetical protein
MDHFTREIKAILETETYVSMSGDVFKTLIVKKVQAYSAELESLNEEISELFLNLTDLIVSGNLSKMPPDALRVYMALGVLSNNPKAPPKGLAANLCELAGLKDEAALKHALDELKARGYIESPDKPILILRRVKATKESRLNDFETS